MSIFDNVFEFTKNVFAFTKEFVTEDLPELGTILHEGVNGLGETVTDGAIEMLVKDNPDYKTSYEIRDLAREKIIYARDKLERAQDSAQEKMKEGEKLQTQLIQVEKRVLGTLAPTSEILPASRVDIYFRSIYKPSSDIMAFNVGNVLGILGTSLRKSAAEQYLSDARDYEVSVKAECARINGILANLKEVTLCMEEEKQLLASITQAVNTRRITKEEARRLLISIIGTPVCNSSYKLSSAYKQKIDQLRRELE